MNSPAKYVLAFDLATRTGWARGEPGSKVPTSGAITLKEPYEDIEEAHFNIKAFFRDIRRDKKPDIVIFEKPETVASWYQRCVRQNRFQNGESLLLQNVLAGIVKVECRDNEIEWVEVARQTVLKHYTGRGTWSSGPGANDGREKGKAAVLKRAHALGHLPTLLKDDDRGDAIALWDYGCSVYGRATPQAFALFDEGKMRNV